MSRRPAAPDAAPALEVAGAAATIRFRRPAAHNRLDPDDLPVIRGHLETIGRDAAIRAVVFTGSGNATFSSGFTVEAIADRLDRSFEDLLDAIEAYPLPTVCALNGSVYGGATDLALCCDFRIGVTGSRMFMPAARFGLHYYPGGLRRYVTILGVAPAKRLFLTAEPIDAAEMQRIGFLTELVAPAELDARVAQYVSALAAGDAAVMASMKRQMNALAAGEAGAAGSRADYEASLKSAELRRRLAAIAKAR